MSEESRARYSLKETNAAFEPLIPRFTGDGEFADFPRLELILLAQKRDVGVLKVYCELRSPQGHEMECHLEFAYGAKGPFDDTTWELTAINWVVEND